MNKALVLMLTLLGVLAGEAWSRPDSWARPVDGAKVGNLYQVDDDVYRSRQPNKEGMANLYDLGIREVLNLRGFFDDEDEAEGIPLTLHRLGTSAARMKEGDLLAALQIIESRDGPILVHCWQGSDRTGAVIAAYRVVVQNWPKDQAIAELIHGGYGFHKDWYENIVTLIRDLDAAEFRRELRLLSSTGQTR